MLCISVAYAVVRCLSVWLSVTFLYCVETAKDTAIVAMESELKWTSHVETVVQKLQRVMGICYKISYKLPDWCLRNIYICICAPIYFIWC